MDNIIPGEIKSVPNSEEILKLLECPCCLEPPIPPIKTCVTGHIICSFCRPRLTKCPICRELYTESRNFPLESIFNACTIACKFWGRGCQQIVPGVKYLDHVKICQYRALCCSHCQESISPVDQYINHLRDKHHAVGYEEERNNYECKNTIEDLNHGMCKKRIYLLTIFKNIFIVFPRIKFKKIINESFSDMRFPDQYALFDGKYFIASSQIRSQFLFIWLSVVEDFSLNLVDGDPNDDVIIEALKKKVDTSHYSAVIAITPEGHSVIYIYL